MAGTPTKGAGRILGIVAKQSVDRVLRFPQPVRECVGPRLSSEISTAAGAGARRWLPHGSHRAGAPVPECVRANSYYSDRSGYIAACTFEFSILVLQL